MGEGFPGGGRRSQPTILVTGRELPLLRRVPLQLLAEQARRGDGAVVAATRGDPGDVRRWLVGGVDALAADRTAVVDCARKPREDLHRVGDLQWAVPSPVAFSQIVGAARTALDALHDRGVDRIHFLLDSLTTQFRLADEDAVLTHAHDLAMALGAESGLGIMTLEITAVSERGFERLRHLVDVHVALRRTPSGPEVRWTGLVGRSDGWVTLSDSGIDFDAMGASPG